jgi:hypothetical protein
MQSIPPLQVLFNQAARTTAPLRGLLWSLALKEQLGDALDGWPCHKEFSGRVR